MHGATYHAHMSGHHNYQLTHIPINHNHRQPHNAQRTAPLIQLSVQTYHSCHHLPRRRRYMHEGEGRSLDLPLFTQTEPLSEPYTTCCLTLTYVSTYEVHMVMVTTTE